MAAKGGGSVTTDDLRTRAREAALRSRDEDLGGPWNGLYDAHYIDGFERGFLAHAAQQPTREQIALAIEDELTDDALALANPIVLADAVLALFDGADR